MTKADELKELVEKYIVIKRKIYRKDMKILIGKIYSKDDPKRKQNISNLLSRGWLILGADPHYTLIRGSNKKTDHFVYTEDAQVIIMHNGIFLCPRCGKKHEISFRPFTKAPIRGQSWAMCMNTKQPVIMTLT